MAQPFDPNQTIDENDLLDAGHAAAFGPNSGPPLAANGSVLKALGAPPLMLREPSSEPADPVLKPHSDTLPTEAVSRYRIDGEIARGGMGAVLKGRDTDLGRDIAVKVLLETHQGKTELVQRFVEEAQIGGQLQHPGVVPVYELGQFADQRPYFTMKLVKGKTLAALLTARRNLAAERTQLVGIFAQICQTLAYAHSRGVIHRDLKPSNVMVGSFGEVQVMDWGLAKVQKAGGVADEKRAQQTVSVIQTRRSGESSSAGSSTQAGSVLGTPAYMSPEQARGEVDLVDARADVFGLGAILCEILTGQPPFLGPKAEAMRKAKTAQLDEAFTRLEGCGAEAELLDLARRCLAAEPWHRPRDAGAVTEAVTAYQNSAAERLRQAELAHAAEVARAEEASATAAQERKAREAAQAMVAAERRARRMTVALAASVLLAVMLGAAGWRWVELKQIARTEALNARVNAALQDAVRLRAQAQGAAVGDLAPWAEAVAAARKADALLEPGVDPTLRQQANTLLAAVTEDERQAEAAVQAAEHDRRLLEQLIDIRSAKTDDRDGTGTDAAYAEAFREAGIDVAGLPPAEAGSKLRARPPAVALALASAVDDWAAVRDKRKDAAGAKRLSAVAQEADPDPWRREFRATVDQTDKATRLTALRELARTARLDELGAISLDLLGTALNTAGDPAAAEIVLRAAARRHPGDVWVNYDLAKVLDKRGRSEEAIRYYMAAKAIRPETAHQLAHALERRGEGDEAILVFQDLVRLRPKNGTHLVCLGLSLSDRGRSKEAKAVFEKAVAALKEEIRLKPDAGVAYLSLGAALSEQGKHADALAAYREAVRLQPDSATPHYNIGVEMQSQGKHDEAITAYREAIRLDPDYAEAHVNSGRSLKFQGKLDAAVIEFREAVRVKPDLAKAHANLAWGLKAQGKYEESLAANREAVRCNPDYAVVYCTIGEILLRKGQYTEGLAQVRKGHEMGSRRNGWQYPSVEWVRKAEQQVEMEGLLPAFLKGAYKPPDQEKRLSLAEVCFAKKLPSAAVGLYADAFAADPKLAADREAGHRYSAACAAALAGTVKADGEPPLDDEAKAKLRQQARAWLESDLAACAKLLTAKNPRVRIEVLERLQRWQSDPNLAGIRDQGDVAKLQAEEREACQKLWSDVAELLKKTGDAK